MTSSPEQSVTLATLASLAEISERAVLGTLLRCPDRFSEVELAASDFGLSGHVAIYASMATLFEDGVSQFDTAAVADRLAGNVSFLRIGGAAYLADVEASAFENCPLEYHVTRIREASIRRRVVRAAEKLTESATNPSFSPIDLILEFQDCGAQLGKGVDEDGNLLPWCMEDNARKLRLISAAEVEDQERKWLIQDFLPDASLTVVAGRGGEGKTTSVMSVAAALTRGVKPILNTACEPKQVLFLTNEDWLPDLKRKCISMGGNPHLLHFERADESLWFLDDTNSLGHLVESHRPGLVVIDSLSSHASDKIDLHKHADVARVMVRLRRIAERHSCAIVIIHHLNKSLQSGAVDKIAGTTAIVNTARHVLMCGRHPEDEELRVLTVAKTNLTKAVGLAYPFSMDPFAWHEPTLIRAEELGGVGAGATPADILGDADRFIIDELKQGPKAARDLIDRAKLLGIAERTLFRAADRQGVKKQKVGFKGTSTWELPDNRDAQPQSRKIAKSSDMFLASMASSTQ